MSTKKVKTPSKKKDEKLTKDEKKALDSIAEQVAKDHEGLEKPQILVSAEQPKKYLVDEIRATKFDMDDDGLLCRKVVEVAISSDEDLSNKPDEANEAIEEGKKKIVEDGFFLSDKEAMDESLFKIEGMVARLATDIEYGKGCRGCATNGLRSVNLALRKLRKFREFRDELQSMIDPKKGSLPAVLPSKKHSDEYAIVDGVFKHVGPKVSIRKIELDDEQKDKLGKILSAVTGEDLDGKTGGLIEVKENNK